MMNVLLWILVAGRLVWGPGDHCSVTVTVTNLEVTHGHMVISIYNCAEDFPKIGGEFRTRTEPVHGTVVRYTFSDLPPGEYAIALYHDENCDGVCNRNFIGIPKEGYGFSNNVHPFLHVPAFQEAAFTVCEEKPANLFISLIQ